MSLTIHIPKAWSTMERVLQHLHQGRNPRKVPSSYVDELVSQRFGCILVCQTCAFRYKRDLMKHDYRIDPEFLAQARCDFCKDEANNLWMFYAEEKFPRLRETREQRNRLRRQAVAPWPEGFRDNGRRMILCRS